jgi:hypothetical protein
MNAEPRAGRVRSLVTVGDLARLPVQRNAGDHQADRADLA